MLLLHFASMAVLAVAVSLDSFGVGITYGLRKISIPFFSIIIIALCSGAVIALSMQAGRWLSNVMSPHIASNMGAIILVGIGIWALYQFLQSHKEQHSTNDNSKRETLEQDDVAIAHAHESVSAIAVQTTATLFTMEVKRLGLVIQILRTPQTADFDSSGNISASEAIMLGIALSLDAFGAGIGAALLGLHPVWTPFIITLCSALFLIAGLQMGKRLAHVPIMKYFSGLPGLLLIILGLIKFF